MVRDSENEAVPVWEPRVVVAVSPPVSDESVPQANPDSVASEPPVERIWPFRVAVEVEMDVALLVETEAAVDGVTAFEAVDEALVPTALVAVTVNVYDTPLVRPVTV